SIGLPPSLPVEVPTGTTPNATVTIASSTPATISYTPKPGFYGSDTFRYVVTDGAESAVGTINASVRDTALAHDLTAFGLTRVIVGDSAGGDSRVLADGTWELTGTTGETTSEGVFEQTTRNGNFTVIARLRNVTGGLGGVMVREHNGA